MKNSMQVMCATLTSMEVAEMVEKRHDNLVRSINRYSAYIEESNNRVRQLKSELAKNETEDSAIKSEVAETEVINLQEFWIKSSYADKQGKIESATISPRKVVSSLLTSVPARKELYSPPGI